MRLRLIVIMAAVFVALGVLFVIAARPRPVQQAESRPIVWSVEMQELEAIAISLPRDAKSEAWVKHADKYWYFDRPGGPKVDMNRWGGGVPLILSGPAAERHITAESTAEQLEEYGLADPRMRIRLALEDGRTIDVAVGDTTPNGQACYLRLVDSRDVYTVHRSWYEVLERLVLEPPYQKAE